MSFQDEYIIGCGFGAAVMVFGSIALPSPFFTSMRWVLLKLVNGIITQPVIYWGIDDDDCKFKITLN